MEKKERWEKINKKHEKPKDIGHFLVQEILLLKLIKIKINNNTRRD